MTSSYYYLRNNLAAENIWHIHRAFPSVASTLSFDGDGYLQPTIFGDSSNYGGGGNIQFNLFMRPNDEGDALVMYAYDTVVRVCSQYVWELLTPTPVCMELLTPTPSAKMAFL